MLVLLSHSQRLYPQILHLNILRQRQVLRLNVNLLQLHFLFLFLQSVQKFVHSSQHLTQLYVWLFSWNWLLYLVDALLIEAGNKFTYKRQCLVFKKFIMEKSLSQNVNAQVELSVWFQFLLIFLVFNRLLDKNNFLMFFLQPLTFLFEKINFVLIFADALKELSVIFLSFDKSVDKFISSLHGCMLFDFSESCFDFIEFLHFSLHF